MVPASNRNVGENIGFPDTCNTPTGSGADAPIPYTNTADNTQATNFSNTVKIEGGNAIHLGTTIPQTSGDESGTDHPTIKGKGAYTTGNPTIFIEQQMAIALGCPTTGNAANNSLGAVSVPSAATVFFSDASLGGAKRDLDVDAKLELARAVAPSGTAVRFIDDSPRLVVERFTEDAASRARAILTRANPLQITLDLRGNGGGDLGAAKRLLELFVPAGTTLFGLREDDDDTAIDVERSRGGDWEHLPLEVWVDGATGSAAEVVAAVLQSLGRATIAGTPTYGKTTVQRCSPSNTAFATFAEVVIPRGEALVPFDRVVPDRAL